MRRFPRSSLIRAGEEEQAADAEGRGGFGFADSLINRDVEDAWHGADGVADALAGTDEERIDEVAGFQRGFAHQGAEGFVRRRRRMRMSGKAIVRLYEGLGVESQQVVSPRVLSG